MNLNLKRPIIFFDLETTGTSILTDRIVEISVLKIMPDGSEIEHTRRVNPGMPIPEAATAIHHITDEDVASAPKFEEIAPKLKVFIEGCDIAGFNSTKFDIPLLDEEFHRAKVEFDFSRAKFIDVQTIFHKKEQRTLSAAYRFYCDKELDGAHSACADTRATYEVLKAQIERYDDLSPEVDKLSEFSTQNKNVDFMGRLIYDSKGRELINFGKYKGKPCDEVLAADPGYYSWVMKGDFAHNTKDAFTKIMLRVKSEAKNAKR